MKLKYIKLKEVTYFKGKQADYLATEDYNQSQRKNADNLRVENGFIKADVSGTSAVIPAVNAIWMEEDERTDSTGRTRQSDGKFRKKAG